jgi:hypothetical protein
VLVVIIVAVVSVEGYRGASSWWGNHGQFSLPYTDVFYVAREPSFALGRLIHDPGSANILNSQHDAKISEVGLHRRWNVVSKYERSSNFPKTNPSEASKC